jgi:hypothetical protein
MPERLQHPDRPLPTVRSAAEAGCLVAALGQDCQNIAPLDPPALVSNDRGDVSLIELPFRCVCGSRLSRIIVSGAAYRDV